MDLVGTMIEGAAEKLKMMPLSDDIMYRRIDDMAPEFGLQLDEATDGSPDLLCAVC